MVPTASRYTGTSARAADATTTGTALGPETICAPLWQRSRTAKDVIKCANDRDQNDADREHAALLPPFARSCLGNSPCIGRFRRLRQPAAAECLIEADDRLQSCEPRLRQRVLGLE